MLTIAPRVVVYPHGTHAPLVEEGWLALAQLAYPPGARALPSRTGAVSTPSAQPAALTWPAAVTAVSAPAGMPQLAFGGAASLAGFGQGAVRGRSARTAAVFGDGSHPTTRLCAGAVDLLCRQRPGLMVLDVGTGTGILARIARARGACFVVGTDIDLAAVAAANAHAALDSRVVRGVCEVDAGDGALAAGASMDMWGVDVGECRAGIHFGDEAPDHWGARFDLVVANILEAPLLALAPALCRALRPGGTLLISGFTRPQVPALRLAYETAGLHAAGDFILNDWVLLRFAAPADHNFSR